ncbi:unnamed protein product, partial [Effrenium voratum]
AADCLEQAHGLAFFAEAQRLAAQRAEAQRQEAQEEAQEEAEEAAAEPLPAPALPAKAKASLGECAICGQEMEAIRLVKTLPCSHIFHYQCIDEYHRQKLREKNVDLPCFTCGAACHKSIAALMAERSKAREQAAEEAARQAKESRAKEPAPRRKGALAALAAASHDQKADSRRWSFRAQIAVQEGPADCRRYAVIRELAQRRSHGEPVTTLVMRSPATASAKHRVVWIGSRMRVEALMSNPSPTFANDLWRLGALRPVASITTCVGAAAVQPPLDAPCFSTGMEVVTINLADVHAYCFLYQALRVSLEQASLHTDPLRPLLHGTQQLCDSLPTPSDSQKFVLQNIAGAVTVVNNFAESPLLFFVAPTQSVVKDFLESIQDEDLYQAHLESQANKMLRQHAIFYDLVEAQRACALAGSLLASWLSHLHRVVYPAVYEMQQGAVAQLRLVGMTTSFMTKLHAGGSRLTCAFGGGGSDAVAELARLERLNFRGPFATGGLDADVVICCGFRRKAEDRAWQGLGAIACWRTCAGESSYPATVTCATKAPTGLRQYGWAGPWSTAGAAEQQVARLLGITDMRALDPNFVAEQIVRVAFEQYYLSTEEAARTGFSPIRRSAFGPAALGAMEPPEKKPRHDGVTDFARGQRDFSQAPSAGESKAICADFTSKEKEYTNGVKAANNWKSHKGPLTGELVRIPDVDSGYPKSVFPTEWEEGQALPLSVQSFDLGNGFPDQNEFRMKFGVIIPSTNTTVEYDYWSMVMSNREVCKGIGFHVSGILIDSPKLATDEDMLHFLAMFRKQLFSTVDRLMTAEPQYIIMGMSLETFFGGWEGNKEFKQELTERTGLNIATGAEACKASLECFGAKRITVLTPYQEIGDRNVVKFFTEIGFEVVRIAGLKCGSATDIAHVPEAWCEKVIREHLHIPNIDAIVQCGTNLSMVPLADRLERELQVPIIAINVACLWFGMREAGIDAKLEGCTRLFREH